LHPYVQQAQPVFCYHLFDLKKVDPEEIRQSILLRIFVRMVRALFSKAPSETVDAYARSLQDLEEMDSETLANEFFRTLIRYIIGVRDDLQFQEIWEVTQSASAERRDVLMTIEQQLIQQGEARGEAKGEARGEARGKLEGKREGKLEGKLEGKVEILWNMFRLKFPSISDTYKKKLQALDTAQLDLISLAFLKISKLEELDPFLK